MTFEAELTRHQQSISDDLQLIHSGKLSPEVRDFFWRKIDMHRRFIEYYESSIRQRDILDKVKRREYVPLSDLRWLHTSKWDELK